MIEANTRELEEVVLVGVVHPHSDLETIKEHLSELAFLTHTASGRVVKEFIQKIKSANPKTLVGKGKIQEIENYIKSNDIGTVIFDQELTPTQQANIERILRCKILDRTALILDIFALRAKTSYAKTQVELAQFQYLLPRLKGLWTHLERQRGGIGLRGPGETEIETDRRIVRDKISLLKKRLATIQKQMVAQRGNRGSMIRVALVGYTNVGKSTLMNLLSKSQVFAEDKLFATLDTTVRKVVLSGIPFLLTDKVGFIRKLPPQLMESFKSTLEEVTQADLLVHVVDISSSNFENHMTSVHQILEELNCSDKPTLLVFNKIDAYRSEQWDETDLTATYGKEHYSLEDWKNTWMQKSDYPVVFISATNRTNIDSLRNFLFNQVKQLHVQRFPYNQENYSLR